MSNKGISLLANVIMPILTILVTVGVFFLFSGEDPGKLFYTNMGITVLLECIFLGYLGFLWIDTKYVSSPFCTVLGVGAFYYVLFGVGWMLIYSLLLNFIVSYAIYMTIHIVALLLWIVIYSQIAQQDNQYKESINTQQNRGKTLDYYSQQMYLLSVRYQSALVDKAVKQPEDAISMDTLLNKMKGLAPSVLTMDTAQSELRRIIDRCEEYIKALEEAADLDAASRAEEKIRRFIKNTSAELGLLRSLAKK